MRWRRDTGGMILMGFWRRGRRAFFNFLCSPLSPLLHSFSERSGDWMAQSNRSSLYGNSRLDNPQTPSSNRRPWANPNQSINQRDLLPQKLPFLDLTESASIRCMKTACSIGFLLKLNEESVCFFIVGSLNSSWYPWGKHFLCVPQRRGLCHYVTGNILVSKPDALDEKNNQIRFFDEIWFPIYVSPIDQWPV